MLYIFLILIFCVNNISPHDIIFDKLYGMIALGSYGDALGAPTEEAGFAGNITSFNKYGGVYLRPFPASKWDDTPWGTWPPRYKIKNVTGVITDDTSIHIKIMELWLQNISNMNEINENNLHNFMNNMEQYLYNLHSNDQLHQRQRIMLSDFLVMYNVAGYQPQWKKDRGNNKFYFKGYPACFGTYMFIDLAAVMPYNSSFIYKFFSNFSRLDQSYGKSISALLLTITSKAMTINDMTNNFSIWFYNELIELIKVNVDDPYMSLISTNVNNSHHIGITWAKKGFTIKQVVYAYKSFIFPTIRKGPLAVSDPLVFLNQYMIGLSYCDNVLERKGNIIDCVLSILHMQPGDTDTVTSQLAQIMGAYYGYNYIKDHNHIITSQFEYIEKYLNTFYNSSIINSAQILQQVYQRLHKNN